VTASTPYAALRHAASGDAARPLITYVGPEGRTELSVRSFQNGVAKAAGLLRDGLDVQPGDSVALLLPAHWQASVWLGACWAVGAVAEILPASLAEAVVVLATEELLPHEQLHAEVLRISLHPFGLPAKNPLPPHVQEAALEVRAHGDIFTPFSEPSPEDPALRLGEHTWRNGEVMMAAAESAGEWGLVPGGRLLTNRVLTETDLAAVLALLAVPLSVDAATIIASGDAPGESPTARLLST
jgi:uncharacterized protein (TIGR03089 family)